MSHKKMLDGNGKEIGLPEGKPVEGDAPFDPPDYPDQRDNPPESTVIHGQGGTSAEESVNQGVMQHKVRAMSMKITVEGTERRERFALRIMAGLAAGTKFVVLPDRQMMITPSPEENAFVAARMADALINQLDAPPQ